MPVNGSCIFLFTIYSAMTITSTPVTMSSAFEKRKVAQPSKAKLEKLRATLANLR